MHSNQSTFVQVLLAVHQKIGPIHISRHIRAIISRGWDRGGCPPPVGNFGMTS